MEKTKNTNNAEENISHTVHPLSLDNIFLHAGAGQLVEQSAHHE